MHLSLRILPALLLATLGSTSVTAQDLQVERKQTRWRFGIESLDAGPSGDVTLLGVHYDLLGIFEGLPEIYAGVGGFTSISGGKNGFFLGGLEAGAVWSPAPRWVLDTGILVGAGGPAGQAVHRGFAIRPYAAAERVFGYWALRGEVAYFDLNGLDPDVVFSLGISLPSELLLSRPGRSSGKIPDGEVLGRKTRMVPRYVLLRPNAGTRRADGTVLPKYQHLMGLGIDYFLSPRVFLPIEVYGGAGGGVDGYLQAGAGLGTSIPFGDGGASFEAKVLGITGGGAGIRTGDSLGWQAMVGLQADLIPGTALEVMAGRSSYLDGDYDADVLSVGVSWRGRPVELGLQYPRSRLAREGLSQKVAESRPMRISVVNKFASPPERATKKDGGRLEKTLSLIGVAMEQPLNDYFSLTGRAYGAWEGDVGGFSQGLLGIEGDYQLRTRDRHHLTMRGEVGAAGGGNVDIRGGLLFAISVGWRYEMTSNTFLTLEVGSEEASEGSYEAEVVQIGLGWGLSRPYLK